MLVKLLQALEPVRAGRPISSRAVSFKVNVLPKIAACLYTEPLAEKIEVDNMGNARDCKMSKSQKLW